MHRLHRLYRTPRHWPSWALSLLFFVFVIAWALVLATEFAGAQTVRSPKGIVLTRDSLLTASKARDSVAAMRAAIDSAWKRVDSLRADHVRARLRPGERFAKAPAQVDGTTVGYLLRTVDGAPVMSDSQYTADTLAIVRGLYKWKGPGKSWMLVPLAMVGGSLDTDRGGYVSSYTQMDKRAHAAAFGALALTVDDRTFAWRGVITAVVVGAAWEVGQMRPSGFPAPHRGQTLGFFDPRDLVADGVGAIVSVGARAAWRAIR